MCCCVVQREEKGVSMRMPNWGFEEREKKSANESEEGGVSESGEVTFMDEFVSNFFCDFDLSIIGCVFVLPH